MSLIACKSRFDWLFPIQLCRILYDLFSLLLPAISIVLAWWIRKVIHLSTILTHHTLIIEPPPSGHRGTIIWILLACLRCPFCIRPWYWGKQCAFCLLLEFSLLLQQFFNRYVHLLIFHLLYLPRFHELLFEFFIWQYWGLIHNPLHDFLVLFVNPLCFFLLDVIIQRFGCLLESVFGY